MTEPTFVRLLNDEGKTYDSYTDFWSLVRLSGLPVCEQNAVDVKNPDRLYIYPMNNGTARGQLCSGAAACRAILWQLERPTGGFDGYLPGFYDQIWVSDRRLRADCADPRVKYVPIGGHKMLGVERAEQMEWDCIHLSCGGGRREGIFGEMANAGVKIAPNGWGEERAYRLARSWVGLCVHQDHLPYIEPLRYTLFSCCKLPLVAEPSGDSFPYMTHPMEAIKSATRWQENYEAMTRWLTFADCVRKAVEG